MTKWKLQPLFFAVSVKFGFGELSICRICAESRDLQSGHGFRACSLKDKGKQLDFHIFGVNQNKTKRTKNDEIGQMLVSRALDDTKTVGKAGADISANFGAGKP